MTDMLLEAMVAGPRMGKLLIACARSGFWLARIDRKAGDVLLTFPAEWDAGAFIRATGDTPMRLVNGVVAVPLEHVDAALVELSRNEAQAARFTDDAREHIARRDGVRGSALPPLVWARWEQRWLEMRGVAS